MSRLFQKKSVLQKIAIVLLITLLCYWIVPTYSLGYSFEELGGDLLKVLMQLLVGIGDMITGALNKFMLGTDKWLGSVMLSQDSLTVSDPEGALHADDSATPNVVLGQDVDINGEDDDKQNEERLVGGINWDNDNWEIPNILYSPEAIFSNRVAALDVNFLNPNKFTSVQDTTSAEKAANSSATFLRSTIASWYAGFRNIAIVALLTVLVFLGIKMVLGAVDEKAKYKESLRDWVVALCLVFFIHFIMSGILMITQKVTELFSEASNDIVVAVVDDSRSENPTVIKKFSENLIGLVRLRVQSANASVAGAYFIMYFVLIGYTIMFTFTYFKRFLYMAFLTMIAPLVAITYPIDKLGDGQAQAFTMWFREYLMNAMMQPLHLVLYTALVSSATNLVVQNPIYALVAIGFLIPAEKFVKSMFGFNKATTPGTLGSFAAGAITGSSIKNLAKTLTGGGGSNSNSGNSKIRTASDNNNNYLSSDDSGDNTLTGFNGGEDNANIRTIQNDSALPPEASSNSNIAPIIGNESSTSPNQGQNVEANNENVSNARASLFSGETANNDENNSRAHLFTDDGNSVVGGSVVLNNTNSRNSINGNSPRTAFSSTTPPVRSNLQAGRRLVVKGVKTGAKKVWKNRGNIARGVLGGAGTALGATMGITAGVANGIIRGDPSAAFSGAIAGASAGAYAGRALGTGAVNATGSVASMIQGVGAKADNVRNSFEKEKFGVEEADNRRKQRDYEKNLKTFLKDEKQMEEAKKVQLELEKRGRKEELKNIMKSRYDYVRAGINNDDIKRAQLAESRNGINGNTHNDYIKVAKQAEKFGINASTFTDDKKYNQLVDSMAATYGSEEQARYAVERLAELKGTEDQNRFQLQRRDESQRISRATRNNTSRNSSQETGGSRNDEHTRNLPRNMSENETRQHSQGTHATQNMDNSPRNLSNNTTNN